MRLHCATGCDWSLAECETTPDTAPTYDSFDVSFAAENRKLGEVSCHHQRYSFGNRRIGLNRHRDAVSCGELTYAKCRVSEGGADDLNLGMIGNGNRVGHPDA